MSLDKIPALDIFLGILGFGFSIMFCTALCRVCHRLREDQLEWQDWLMNREASRASSVFIIPVPGSRPLSESDDPHREPRYSQELHRPPRYSTAMHCGPPPSYDELVVKPDDLPPDYTEHTNVPIYPISAPPQADVVQPHTPSQP